MTTPSDPQRSFVAFLLVFCGALAAPRAAALPAGAALVPGADSSEMVEIVDTSTVSAPSLDDSLAFSESPLPRRPRFRPNSLTFSPVHLVGFLTAEAMLERAFDSHFSMAGFGAIGFPFPEVNGRVYELGGQLRWYPKGQGRHAIHFGLEAFWAHVSFSFEDDGGFFDDLEGSTEVKGAGPFFGYKFTSQGGVIAEFQFGYQAMAVTGDVLPFPIMNFNLGQAF
jgi:hypothetical protein